MKTRQNIIFTTLAFILSSSALAAGAGFPDPAFGAKGEIIVPFDAGGIDNDIPKSLLAGPGGVTYQVGSVATDKNPNFPKWQSWAIGIARITHTGNIDVTYGNGGRVIHIDPSLAQLNVGDAALNPDGKVVVVGRALGDDAGLAICRFDTRGQLDTTFGDPDTLGCKFEYSEPPRSGDAVAMDAKGRAFVVSHHGVSPAKFQATLTVFDSDGQIDMSFNEGNPVIFPSKSWLHDVDINTAGNVIVAGWTRVPEQYSLLAMIDGVSGVPVETFGKGGFLHFGQSDTPSQFSRVSITPENSILVAGLVPPSLIVAKFDQHGNLEDGFGKGGIKTLLTATAEDTYHVGDLLADSEDEIIVGVNNWHTLDQWPFQTFASLALKLAPNGDVDEKYGMKGIALGDFSASPGMHDPRLVKQGARLLIGASVEDFETGMNDYAVMRFDHGLESRFIVTPKSGKNGTLKPSMPVAVAHSNSHEFQLFPIPGFKIEAVTGCGGALFESEFVSKYVTGPVTADCTIEASFTSK